MRELTPNLVADEANSALGHVVVLCVVGVWHSAHSMPLG